MFPVTPPRETTSPHIHSETGAFYFNRRYMGYPDSGRPQYHSLLKSTVMEESELISVETADRYAPYVAWTILILLLLLGLSGSSRHESVVRILMLSGVLYVVLLAGVLLLHANPGLRQKYRRLTTPGASEILSGEIASCQVKTYRVYRWFSYSESHRTTLAYRFVSPTGATLQARRIVSGKLTLPPGTPVRVLYADDETFVML